MPENIRSADIARALAIYLAVAFEGNGCARPVPVVHEHADIAETLGAFIDESRFSGDERCPRYALRLGNKRYPHMKFVVERALQSRDFFFSADTHDQVGVCEQAVGKDEWKALQEINLKYKLEIEKAWYDSGLPTLRTVNERARPATDPRHTRGRSILIVDDEPDAAHLLGIALAREGYVVTTAYGGAQALVQAREHRPDLVLLDYMMPEMSGREVCERLKADTVTCNIPVVIATYAELDRASLSLADDIIRKPFNARELVQRVGVLLQE